jgi:hypothetical protein
MKDMYRRESYDLLINPDESSKKIRANSPATRLEEVKRIEEEKRPDSLNAYGIAAKKNYKGVGLSGPPSMANAASIHGKHKGSDSGIGVDPERPDAGKSNNSSF